MSPGAMAAPTTWLRQLLAQRYTPPFKHELPGTVAEMLAAEPWRQKARENGKLLRRWLWLQLGGQARLLHDRLPPPPARLLWLSPSSNSIGDSVMELSGRALLGAYEVDLLSEGHYAGLYRNDRYFRAVFSDPDAIDASRYDFAIQDFFNTRSLRIKRHVCPNLPFAALQGFFWGPDYNRMLFSCYRIHHLLGYPHSAQELRPYLRPHLFLEDEPPPLPRLPGCRRVALAVGGKFAARTYRRWPEVLRHLVAGWPREQLFPEFVLVGSKNGLADVPPVRAALGNHACATFVDALSLRASARLIADCDFFVGTDGGLMHCAVAVDLPGVALFGKVPPNLRLPPEPAMRTFYDASDVSNISPEAVAEAIQVDWQGRSADL
jgi:heptosyltransferase-2